MDNTHDVNYVMKTIEKLESEIISLKELVATIKLELSDTQSHSSEIQTALPSHSNSQTVNCSGVTTDIYKYTVHDSDY
jgi:dGTP triphosphohydrolase